MAPINLIDKVEEITRARPSSNHSFNLKVLFNFIQEHKATTPLEFSICYLACIEVFQEILDTIHSNAVGEEFFVFAGYSKTDWASGKKYAEDAKWAKSGIISDSGIKKLQPFWMQYFKLEVSQEDFQQKEETVATGRTTKLAMQHTIVLLLLFGFLGGAYFVLTARSYPTPYNVFSFLGGIILIGGLCLFTRDYKQDI